MSDVVEGFIRDAEGPPGTFAVFEDDGDTGYLYVYVPDGGGILRHLRTYGRSEGFLVRAEAVEVGWSGDSPSLGWPQ